MTFEDVPLCTKRLLLPAGVSARACCYVSAAEVHLGLPYNHSADGKTSCGAQVGDV